MIYAHKQSTWGIKTNLRYRSYIVRVDPAVVLSDLLIIMRGLIVCLVAVNLALANGYGFIKSYEFPGKEVIHVDEPFGYGNVVYGVCERTGPVRKCKIYQELTQDEYSAVQSCDVNLKSTNVILQHAGRYHIIVTVKDGSKASVLTLHMGSCSIKETTIETDTTQSLVVVPRENSFDVIFENHRQCWHLMCKATVGFDGKIIKAVAPFGIRAANSTLLVKPSDQGFLVSEDDGNRVTVYFVRDNDLNPRVLDSMSSSVLSKTVSLSTAENKLSLCLRRMVQNESRMTGTKIQCQQFDAEGKIKILEFETLPRFDSGWNTVDILNLEKGLLWLWQGVEKYGQGLPQPVIEQYDKHGKQTKFTFPVQLQCIHDGYDTPRLFINSIGDYCVASICRKRPLYPETLTTKMSRTYECSPKLQ